MDSITPETNTISTSIRWTVRGVTMGQRIAKQSVSDEHGSSQHTM